MPETIDNPVSSPPRVRSPRTIALLLIGIGALLVINQSGVLGDAVWSVLLPVGMIAFGLDLVTNGARRRQIGVGTLLALVVLTPLVGVSAWFERPALDDDAAQQFTFTDIDQLRANIEMTAGDLRVSRIMNDDAPPLQLQDGRFAEQVREDRIGVALIRPRDWDGDVDLRVNPRYPLSLTANVGAGDADELDFSDTRLQTLNLTIGAGDTNVTLPNEGVIDVTINGSIGDIELNIPDEMQARVEIESTIGGKQIDDRFQQQPDGVYITEGYSDDAPNRATIRINSTVGEITVD